MRLKHKKIFKDIYMVYVSVVVLFYTVTSYNILGCFYKPRIKVILPQKTKLTKYLVLHKLNSKKYVFFSLHKS